jgi:phosphohistidine phosphatase
MRHAEAEGMARSDAGRSLTPRGFGQARLAGQWLARQGVSIEMICHSPYLRAKQTTAEVCHGLISPLRLELEELAPSGDLQRLLTQGEQLSLPGDGAPASMLWVTHQPLVGNLANFLTEGTVGNGYPFAPASVMLLEYDYFGPACAAIAWLRDVADFG